MCVCTATAKYMFEPMGWILGPGGLKGDWVTAGC